MRDVRVLYFEDNPAMRTRINKALKLLDAPFVVEERTNALFSRSIIESMNPDIIISDLNLPMINLDEILESVVATGRPLIIHTGCSTAETICRIKKALGTIPDEIVFCFRCSGIEALSKAVQKIIQKDNLQ